MAQGSTSDAAGLPDAQQLDDLISTLESDEERKAFVDNLQALADAQRQVEEASPDQDNAVVGGIAAAIDKLDQRLRLLLDDLDDGSAMAAWIAQQAQGDLRGLWLQVAWQVPLTIGLGVVGWLLVGMMMRGHMRRLEQREVVGWLERPLIALGRLSLRIIPIGIFVIVAYVVMLLVAHNDLSRTICVVAVNAVALTRVGVAIVHSILAPLSPQLRALPISDREAAYLLIWSRRFLAVGIYGFFATDLLASLGLPESSVALLLRLVGLAILILAFTVILQSRQAVADWIRSHPDGGGGRRLRQRLADIWHVLAILAAVALYIAWALDASKGFVFLLRGFGFTAIAIFGALLATTLVRRGLDRMFRIGDEFSARFPGLEKRSNRYAWLFGWLLNTAIWLTALVVVCESWGISALEVAASPDGSAVISSMSAVLAVLVIAIVAWELGDGAISNYLSRRGEETLNPRLETLLPLLRNVLLVVIATIAAITTLAELGLDIGPLLAGAGVIGLAIGFGAQALVKDVITGAFILFEDQFSIGDWIDAGGKMGGVESISIRTVKLRDIDGYVHTIPFGEITALTNMMRDYGFAVIDIGVAYQENTDRVLEVIRQVDEDARKDGDLAERLAGDLEVMGVNAVGDSSVTLRVRIRTLAGYQWGVRRDYLRLIKLRFDEVGIEIPFPHMTVYFGEKRGGTTPPAIVRLDANDPEPGLLKAAGQENEEAE
ncbi:MAG: mechanosensitive ion channel, partial [Rhodospirillaceae bacterium]|nr:mechanosensitive ion channel [Rhodospirillaceae bacterium]